MTAKSNVFIAKGAAMTKQWEQIILHSLQAN